MAYLIVQERGRLKKFEITEDILFIGSSPESDVMVADPGVSPKHCQVVKTEGGFRLIDLGSETGTIVAGKKVKQAALREGQVFQVGSVKIAVKEIGAKAAASAPSAAGARSAPVPAGRSTVSPRAPARGRAAGRGARERAPIRIRKEMAAASARGGHLVRKNPRKASNIPGWAWALIAFWGVVILVGGGYLVIKYSTPSSWGAVYKEGLDLWEKEHNLDAAFAKFASIPENDPVYGEKSREQMKRIGIERDAGNRQYDAVNAANNYKSNILLFIHKYIDAPPNKPSWGLKIKREYAPDRASYVRILLKDRVIPYLERFKGAPQYPDVKKLYDKYSKEVNVDAPPSFRDVELEADCWLNLSHYGDAYRVMSEWLAGNPDTKYKDRADWTFQTIWNRLQEEWRIKESDIEKNEKDGKPAYAVNKLKRLLRLTEGLESPEGKKFRADLEARMAANQAKVDAARGLGREQ